MARQIITGRWYHREAAAHEKALGSPQRFPLTGDGDRLRRLVETVIEYGADIVSAPSRDRLATARYRDWRSANQRDPE